MNGPENRSPSRLEPSPQACEATGERGTFGKNSGVSPSLDGLLKTKQLGADFDSAKFKVLPRSQQAAGEGRVKVVEGSGGGGL